MRLRRVWSQLLLLGGLVAVALIVLPGIQSATSTQDEWWWTLVYWSFAGLTVVVVSFLTRPRRASLLEVTSTISDGSFTFFIMRPIPAHPGAKLKVEAIHLGDEAFTIAAEQDEPQSVPWSEVTRVSLARDGLGAKSRIVLHLREPTSPIQFQLLKDDGYAFASSASIKSFVAQVEARLMKD